MLKRRQQMHQECSNGIRDGDLKMQRHEEGGDIWQELQEDHSSGGQRANSCVFNWAVESE
jgi:hypothetical protein